MSFAKAQVFVVDPTLVQSAGSVALSRVDLYFSGIPNASANKSGIAAPGVTLALLPTVNSVPALDSLATTSAVHVGYADVRASGDASQTTTFRFTPAAPISTGTEYALCVIPDGDEDFTLWTSTIGDELVGNTGSAATPPSAVGPLYDYISPVPLVAGVGASSNTTQVATANSVANTIAANSSYTTAAWRADTGQCLTFDLYVSRYSVAGNTQLGSFVNPTLPASGQVVNASGTPVQNTISGDFVFTLPARRYEYVVYDAPTSNTQVILPGERVFQNTVFWPGGQATPATISVTQGSNVVTAVSNTINWASIISLSGLTPEWLIAYSLNHRGANADSVAVRQIVGATNTTLQLDSSMPFTNTACYFMRSPTAVVDQMFTARFLGGKSAVLVLKDSTGNSSIRFTNNQITNVAPSAIGVGYSNSDFVTLTGFESVPGVIVGGYAATANVNTFANGSLQSIYISNVGCGFVNVANISAAFTNSTGHPSTGSGATLTYQTGTIYKTEFLGTTGTGGTFQNCALTCLDAGSLTPRIICANPPGTAYTATLTLPYYSTDTPGTTFSGRSYFVDPPSAADVVDLKNGSVEHSWQLSKRRMTPSWSLELVTPYANGTNSNGTGGGTTSSTSALTTNAAVLTVTASSNSDFSALAVNALASAITYCRFVINNDYTGENTNYGNAWAKGIETKFNIQANGHFAESLLAYTTAYRPANTDVLMLARLYNSVNDQDTFAVKDWTLLPQVGGNSVYSSPTDLTTEIELTYALPLWPNVAFTTTGFATTAANSSNVIGTNTAWHTNATSNIVVGSLVRIYQPLFSNTDYMVSVVTAVANDTQFTIADPVTNNGVIGAGMLVDVIGFPFQAFQNPLNQNVVRYYDSNMAPHDGFDTVQVKLVMTSANGMIVPFVDDVRFVGVSS